MTRSQWQSDRVKSIGASESAGILGVSPWSSPLSVWMDKTNPQEHEQNEWQEWGHRVEPAILEAYHEKTGDDIYQWPQDQHIYHPRFPDVPMSCTPDGGIFVDVMDMDNPGLTKVIDAKNVASWKRDEWRDGPPLWYVIQMQHQMAVTGAESAALAVLFGGNHFESYEVERDDAFIAELEQACVRFWNDYVVTGIMPPADTSPPTVKALAKFHADDSGDSVEQPAADSQRETGRPEEGQSETGSPHQGSDGRRLVWHWASRWRALFMGDDATRTEGKDNQITPAAEAQGQAIQPRGMTLSRRTSRRSN
jgi:putative phage-type endonuclease